MQSEVQILGTQINLLWVVIGAALVVFMQAGFALVETGFTRAKHAAHVMSTNFAIFGLGLVKHPAEILVCRVVGTVIRAFALSLQLCLII